MGSLRGTALILLTALAIGGCGGAATPEATATTSPTASPSPQPTSTPTVLPNPTPTATVPPAVLSICQETIDIELRKMMLAFIADWDGDWDVYVISGDGSILRPFTESEEDESGPKWSPDGQWLAYQVGHFESGFSIPKDMHLFIAPAEGVPQIPMAPDLRYTFRRCDKEVHVLWNAEA